MEAFIKLGSYEKGRETLSKKGGKTNQGTFSVSVVDTVSDDLSNKHRLPFKEKTEKLNSPVTVKTLNYCKSALSVLKNSSESAENVGLFPGPAHGGNNHDFLVIEFALQNMESMFILAEKLGHGGQTSDQPQDEPAKVGIRIGLLEPRFKKSDFQKNIYLPIECNVQAQLQTVRTALQNHEPDSNVADLNCWDYAFDVTKKLLNALADECGDPEKKSTLDGQAQRLREDLVNMAKIDFGHTMEHEGAITNSGQHVLASARNALQG